MFTPPLYSLYTLALQYISWISRKIRRNCSWIAIHCVMLTGHRCWYLVSNSSTMS